MASSKDKVIELRNAVSRGDKDLVLKLLDQEVDPNQFGSQSISACSPLMVACLNGRLDLVRLLISRGADVDLHTGRHETALSKVITSTETSESVKLGVIQIRPKLTRQCFLMQHGKDIPKWLNYC